MTKIKTHVLAQAVNAVAKSLREFGYPDATNLLITEYYAKWKRGEADGDIIFKFATTQFDEHPDLFGTPEPKP